VSGRSLVLDGEQVRTALDGAAAPPSWSRLEVLRAGICGTDVQISKGMRPERPRVLGHEGAARMLAAAGRPARTVLFNPVSAVDQDAILGHSYDGIFRDEVAVPPPAAGGPSLVDADPRLVLDLAPLVEPLATVLYSRQLLGEAAGASVGIWGAGPTGLLHAILASRAGARAHVVHHGEPTGWIGEELGIAVEGAVPADDFTAPRLKRANGGRGLAAAVICVPRTGAAAALAQALEAIEPGGVIDLFGGFGPGQHHPQLPGVDLGAIRRRNVRGAVSPPVLAAEGSGKPVALTGHRGTSDAQLREAQELLVGQTGAFAPVVSHVVSLPTAGEWLSQRMHGRWPVHSVAKVVIDMSRADSRPRKVDMGLLVGDAA
jgi:threonine dehydrogenase-like Zn-dependent dehydrogenase